MSKEKELEAEKYQRLDELKAEQTKINLARFKLRQEKTNELLRLSGEKLPDDELRFRIEELMWRYDKIAFFIPAPITFHLEDRNDKWDLECGYREDGLTRFMEMKRKESDYEYEIFTLETRPDYVLALHSETRQPQLTETQNSEREIKPAEVIFEEIWSPLEKKLETPYSIDSQNSDS